MVTVYLTQHIKVMSIWWHRLFFRFLTLCEMTPFVAAPDIIMKRNEMQIPIVGMISFNGMQTTVPKGIIFWIELIFTSLQLNLTKKDPEQRDGKGISRTIYVNSLLVEPEFLLRSILSVEARYYPSIHRANMYWVYGEDLISNFWFDWKTS